MDCALPEEAAPEAPVKWPIDLRARDADTGVVVLDRVWVSFMPCRRAARPPAVDADLGDWAGPPAVLLKDAAWVRPRRDWGGPADLSGAVRLAWDDRGLYLAVEVRDADWVEPAAGPAPGGDSIQVAFDPVPGVRQEYHQQTMDYSKKYSEYTLALTAAGPAVYRAISWDRDRPAGPVPASEAGLAVRRTAGGAVYEAAFTWAGLSMDQPEPGRAIGLALALQDADPGDRPGRAMEWFGGIVHVKDPDKFGQIVLMP